jgi:hypothetical protein
MFYIFLSFYTVYIVVKPIPMPKMEIKNEINDDKTTFYIFKALNTYILR